MVRKSAPPLHASAAPTSDGRWLDRQRCCEQLLPGSAAATYIGAQLPLTIQDEHGTITAPREWIRR